MLRHCQPMLRCRPRAAVRGQPRSGRHVAYVPSFVSPDGCAHTTPSGEPLYRRRFRKVTSFHPPGLAAVVDADGFAFHIDQTGHAVYRRRFTEAYGFYCGLAAVNDGGTWYHITAAGEPAYAPRWAWCGNFARVPGPAPACRCPVRGFDAAYRHIDAAGAVRGGPYAYCGDFNTQGVAVVWDRQGAPRHVDVVGRTLYRGAGPAGYLDVRSPHKSVAAVRDVDGWFYVDVRGQPLGPQRYRDVEPHYNGQALVRLGTGERAVVDERGRTLVTLPESPTARDADLVSLALRYQRPLALKLALEHGLLDALDTERASAGADRLCDDPMLRDLVLGVCAEMGLCARASPLPPVPEVPPPHPPRYTLTARGAQLLRGGSTVADRCRYWLQDRYLRAWLPSLWPRESARKDAFSQLTHDPDALELSQRVLQSYAEEDWKGIAEHLPLRAGDVVVDLAGGTGALLREVARAVPDADLQLRCVERPEVVEIARTAEASARAPACAPRVTLEVGDLFEGTLPEAHVYILSRVLHDWDDARARRILKRVRAVTAADGRLVVIDRQATDQQPHAALSLHMYLLNGAHERTEGEWQALFGSTGWTVRAQRTFNGHVIWTLGPALHPTAGPARPPVTSTALPRPRLNAPPTPALATAACRPTPARGCVTKAVVPIAGLGMRVFPQSLAVPKALFPVVVRHAGARAHTTEVRPALHSVLQQLLHTDTGIDCICLVAAPSHLPALTRYLRSLSWADDALHCCPHPLATPERVPCGASAPEVTAMTADRTFLDGRICIVCQDSPQGSGDALMRARAFVDGQPFLVVLGDHLFTPGCVQQVLRAYADLAASGRSSPQLQWIGLTGACICSSAEVPTTGLLKLHEARRPSPGVAVMVSQMEEKPVRYDHFELPGPGGYLCHVGLDVLPATIFEDLAHQQRPLQSTGDSEGVKPPEVDLRVAMKRMQERQQLFACLVQGTRLDIGTPSAYWDSLVAVHRGALGSSCTAVAHPEPDADVAADLWAAIQRLPLPEAARAALSGEWPRPPMLASAPGRVDLMGGFADYSGSDVLGYPTALRTYAFVALTDRTPGALELVSVHVPSVRTLLQREAPAAADGAPEVWHRALDTSILFDDTACVVLPAALRHRLDRAASAARPCDGGDAAAAEPPNWPSYVVGVLHALLLRCSRDGVALPLRGSAPAEPSTGGPRPPATGVTVCLVSDLPPKARLASSAAVEVAVALAAGAAMALPPQDPSALALMCQAVENDVVGTPCGFMDQMQAAHASAHALTALRCRLPVAPQAVRTIAVPPGLSVWALPSGARRAVGESPYRDVRVAAAMGRAIINRAAAAAERSAAAAALPGPVMHLCEIPPSTFNTHFRHRLPVAIAGADFLREYGPLCDGEVGAVDPELCYAVRAATAHPIEEHCRVQLFRSLVESLDVAPAHDPLDPTALDPRLLLLGELMAQAHASYTACGMGSAETDLLVHLLHRESVAADPRNPLVGAKIMGGGCGGTVVAVARDTPQTSGALRRVCERYAQKTGHASALISGSSGGARVLGAVRRYSSSGTAARPRVLLVNHGYPPQFNGGSEVYTQTLAIALLRSGACAAVDVFAREHDGYRADFTVRSCADALEPRLPLHLINVAREAPYTRFVSDPIDHAFEVLLRRLRPNIVHFGHLNHLSVRLPAVAKAVVPQAKVLYTLHDFWLLCPRGQFLIVGPTAPDGTPWRQCDAQDDRKCAVECYVGRFATGLPSSSPEAPLACALTNLPGPSHAPPPHSELAMNATVRPCDEVAYWADWIGARMAAVREACASVDAFISPSVHLQRQFQSALAVPPERLILLPYGFDRTRLLGRRQRLMAAQDPFVFGYIGRHHPSKGLDLLIDAAIALVKEDPATAHRFRVLVFGRPEAATTAALRRRVDESLLARCGADVIEWRPEYGNADIVRHVFDHVDAIVVPSIWDENSPLVIHEAQQCHVPVITSEKGGMGELVQNGVNGLTFRHRDAASLARAMRTAILMPNVMRRLGRRGYLHSDDGQVPSVEQHVAAMRALYMRLLQGHAAGPAGVRHCGQWDGLRRLADAVQPAQGASEAVIHGPDLRALAETREAESQGPDAHPRRLGTVPAPIVSLAAPWRITFDTNPDDCNFKCTMCEQHSEYSPHQRARKAGGVRRRRMDFELIAEVVEQMAPLGLREIIPSTMGEPLMYKEFPRIVALCAQHNIKLNLTTNGSFWGRGVDAWARLIVPVCSDVKFSWNGATEQTQQRIMKGAAFAAQLAHLKAFISVRDEVAAAGGNRCSVTLQMTFMEQNLQEIPDVVRLAIEHGCDRVKGHHLWAHFNEIADQDLRRNPESVARWNAVAAECRGIAARAVLPNGLPLRLDNFFDIQSPAAGDPAVPGDGAERAARGSSQGTCPFLGREAWINHAGRFDPCCAPDDQRRALGAFGNVRQKGESLLEIWQSDRYRKLVQDYWQHPLCESCNMRKPPQEHEFL